MGVLPGIGGIIAAAGPFADLTFVDSSSGGGSGTGSVSATIPSGAQEGDLCIWMQSLFGSSVTNSVPSGFTSLVAKGIVTSGLATQWAYKILSAGDPGALKTGGSVNAGSTPQKSVVALVWRPNAPISSVTLGAAINDQDSAGNNPAAQSLNLSGNTNVLIAFAHMMGGTAVTARTVSPAMAEVQGAANWHWVLHSLAAENYSNIDLTTSASCRLQSGYIVVT